LTNVNVADSFRVAKRTENEKSGLVKPQWEKLKKILRKIHIVVQVNVVGSVGAITALVRHKWKDKSLNDVPANTIVRGYIRYLGRISRIQNVRIGVVLQEFIVGNDSVDKVPVIFNVKIVAKI